VAAYHPAMRSAPVMRNALVVCAVLAVASVVGWTLLVHTWRGGDAHARGYRDVQAVRHGWPDHAPAECELNAQSSVRVPDVVGLSLYEAIGRIEANHLYVIGTGTPAGDPPSADARVIAQEPASSTLVLLHACVGFRTQK
jgi:hypothetical protein